MADRHPFDEVTRLTQADDGTWRGAPTAEYANFGGPFGGATAATLMRAVTDHPDRQGDPVAITVNFCGAMTQNPFAITASERRSGKYTQHWSLDLEQDGEIRATATVVCGARSGTFTHHTGAMPDAPPFDAVAPLPDARILAWMSHYDMRYVAGPPPQPTADTETLNSADSVKWIADKPERPLDAVSLVAMSDAFMIRLYHVRPTFQPMGTVTLTTYIHATADEIAEQGTTPLLGTATAHRFHANFQDQRIELWGKNGNLLASGVQVAWYKE